MTFALRYAVRSDVGLLREGNEDSAYAGPHLLAIADGMGGHAAGEVASAVAISALAGLDQAPGTDLLDPLADAVARANTTLHEMSLADPAVEGMGTTLTAMLWQDARVALCHIGDSRAYLLRDGDFSQITRDHTLVQSLVDDGRLTPEAAASHPQRSLLLRALDGRSEAEPDLSIREVRLGDRYLLCSDGLSDVVTEQTLHKTLLSYPDLDGAVLQLVELAIRSGGPDNITCIVADVIDAATWPDGASQAAVIAGAASSTDGTHPLRTDSPAGRAHQLTQVSARPFSDTADFGDEPAAAPNHTRTSHRRSSSNGDDDGEYDDAADFGDDDPRWARRRWPVVTSILVILLLLVGGGGYAAWRYTQDQYYVGAADGQVAIFRGVNEQVAGMSLSSVYDRTGIPMSGVPASDAKQVQATIMASGLADAQGIVLNIRHGYVCQQAFTAVQQWTAGKPKPHKVKRKVHGKTVVHVVTPKYRPKPPVPSYCPPQQGGSA
jgi:PPM family protein phosphatase